MKLIEGFWTTVTVVVNWFTLSPIDVPDGHQSAILPKVNTVHAAESIRIQNLYNIDPALEYEISDDGKGPKFRPPTGRPKGRLGSDLKCEYPTLGPDWIPCSTAANRECWLKNTKTGEQYNITTDYEKITPPGVVRDYTLVLSNKTINADGIDFPYGKVFSYDFPEGEDFDGTFPGPWIQACWGDILNVTVYNRLPYTGAISNGTSIHWHGLRQLDTMQFDGVNGITQCPIAPGDHFTYTYPVMQYGSTWYHSHYSMQYADGTQGPLTLHGPTSAPFDYPLYPLIITDWGHNSAFAATYPEIGLKNPSIVLNGKGNINRFSGKNINTTVIPDTYHVTFEPGKRYLMRVINTAFETGFRFSIDGHKFDVVQNDLVPIEPYTANSIVVHIGQRYNIVVQAKEKSDIGDGNFWIRTTTCYTGSIQHGPGNDWMKTGIVRYNDQSTEDPTDRTSIPWPFSQNCDDEPLGNIHPKHKWTVGPSKNSITQGENIRIGFTSNPRPYIHAGLLWNIKDTMSSSKLNFQIHYHDPIFLRLADPKPRPAEVVVYSSENYTADDWAYIVIASAGGHPIHLHGHDFAVVYQSDKQFSPDDIKSTCPDNKNFRCDNPPRRDVIMPHDGTYAVIAFKTDNPGSWLMHCHIASHAGAGLDLQILERPQEAAAMWPPGSTPFVEAQRVCKNWDQWWGDIKIVQDDSGV